MCRNIKKLRMPGQAPTEEELKLAALQYIRKVSGFHAPSRANTVAFDSAVLEVADTTRRLLANLVVHHSPEMSGSHQRRAAGQ